MSPDPRLLKIFNDLPKQRVRSVDIALGELFPFNEEQVRLQWNELAEGTLLAQTELNIRSVRAEQQCMTCFEKYHPLQGEISCPHCGSFGAKILAGEEFHLETIEAEDE